MKKMMSLLLALSFVITLFAPALNAVQAATADGYDYIFLNHASFTVDNGWLAAESNTGGYSGNILRSGAAGAETSAYVKSGATGEYDLWVRTVDFKSSPGTRTFSVRFNTGYLYRKAGSFDDVDWSTVADGGYVWKWECIGSVYMTEGVVNKITMIADNNFTRFDCMLLTNNPSYTPLEKAQISTLETYMQNSSSMTYNKDMFGTTRYAFTRGAVETSGTWTLNNSTYLRYPEEHTYAFFGGYMCGRSDSNPDLAKDAVLRPYIYEGGTYSVWVRTGQDPYSTNSKADGLVLDINGKRSDTLGFHTDKPGFAWEYAGEYEFNSGVNTIRLVDTLGFWARFNCICITKDKTCAPSNYEDEFKESISFTDLRPGSAEMVFAPEYIKNSTVTPSSTISISNEKVSVEFFNVSDGTNQFVQNKVTYDGYVLKDREDMLARQLYRYGAATRVDHTRGSPLLNIKNISAMNTAKGDWVTDSWGVPKNKIWTNIGEYKSSTQSVSNIKGEKIKVKLNIPVSGNYYGVTRGYTHNLTDNKRGYIVSVNGNCMTSDNSTHYFNVTNATEKGVYAFSYNKDPIYLQAGVAEIELTSFDDYAMRTSFFALIPAENTTALQAEISKLTDFETAVSLLGGDALESAFYGDVPVTKTGYPYPITYDYVQKINEPFLSVKTDNIFNMGVGEWLIPKSAKKTGENQVTLTYENDYVDVTEIWELKSGDEEPRVSLSFTAKKRGGYYVVIPTHERYSDDEYEYGLAPMQYRGHQFPAAPLLITEQFLFTPMVSVSLPESNNVVPGKKVTYGYTVEPSWLENRWVYYTDYDFGAVMRSSQHSKMPSVSPSLVASAPGGRNKEMLIGQSYTIKFRPIYRIGDWFQNFSHVTSDLFEVRDYRENYYNSVTDAILNTTDLMMDDFYSGWDDNNMSFWNMEGRAFTTQGSPLEVVQRYLLTDNAEILRERAVPTIVSVLTRATHFKSNETAGGSQSLYLGGPETWPTAIGTEATTFGASVLGGIYEMTQGSLKSAFNRAVAKANSIASSNSTGASVSDLVAMYKYTGEQTYLNKAKLVADNYLASLEKTKTATTPTEYTNFAYISYMPHISGLIDIYEVTGEQKYLDAAEYAGQVILTLVWSSGIDGNRADEQLLLDAESIGDRPFMANHDFWWMGEFKWRPGVDLDENMRPTENPEVPLNINPARQKGFDEIEAETVPSWLVSRVGIGLEQPSTFYAESVNIIMSNWAGDLMRLAEYLDNKQFEAAARNAIVGRFGTYPGYYINRFATLHMKENYHTESPVDITSVYWHHIPSFLSMVEDFLIAQAWNWSDKNIEFPSTRQQGYAYFNNRQYGYEAGKFFDESNMWLWIDDGILSTSSVNLDWIAARKDGTMGVALMNESSVEETFEIQLGDKADADYSGGILLYKPDGSFTSTNAANGKFTVTIPAKSLIGAVIKSEEIKAPSFANSSYVGEDSITNVKHTDVSGAGSIIQLTPDSYFAHIYIENKYDTASEITVNYTFGDDKTVNTVSDNVYPYEVIIEAGKENVTKPINYTVTVKNADGTSTVTSKSYTMKPMNCVAEEIPEEESGTVLLTGKNYADALGYTTQNKWDKLNFILSDYGLYRENNPSSVITTEIPADGNYYIYANTRSGHSSLPERRYISMSITQNGLTQTVKDSDNSQFKFGYSSDVKSKLSDITASTTTYWMYGLGTMAPKPVYLKKGTADIKLDFGAYGGFDFILLTSDAEVRAQLDECRSYEGFNIFKFWKDNTELKEMLMSYVDVTGSDAPVISDKTMPYSPEFKIEIKGSDDILSYRIFVNDVLKATISAADLEKNSGIATVPNVGKGDKVYVTSADGHGNSSKASNVIISDITPLRPATFAHLLSGINYDSVTAAKNAGALPNGYFALFTQENFVKDSNVTKVDTNLMTGVKDNYYLDSGTFKKSFSGNFVIPETEEDTYYQFISSYLRVHQSSTVWIDDRRTHFLLIDGKALTENGLEEWNGSLSYSREVETGNYGTNSYVFGSEYPFEFTTANSTTKIDDISKIYPHSVVKKTAHLWGYSPVVKLEPGVHTVEVYSRGNTGWFNNLIITDDVGYDITKLLYGGLNVRATDWANNFKNVLKPNYTDYTAPVLSGGITATAGTSETTLKWAEASDAGFGATGKNVGYIVEILDSNGGLVKKINTTENSAVIPNLPFGKSYKAVITAYDGVGNKSASITETITINAPAISYVHGESESEIVFNASVNKNCAGDNRVFVVGYNTCDYTIDSIQTYDITVAENKSGVLKFATPAKKEGVIYRVFVWQKPSMKPLCLSITAKTK